MDYTTLSQTIKYNEKYVCMYIEIVLITLPCMCIMYIFIRYLGE